MTRNEIIASKDKLNSARLLGANLSGADLSHAKLLGAHLSGVDLSGADLSRADLSSADLSYTNLRGADLRGAKLSVADLRSADLRDAKLIDADLSYTNLRGANLGGAKLTDADLSYTNLRGADLNGAYLIGANLSDANLSGTRGLLDPADFMNQFEKTSEGLLVYKVIGKTEYCVPAHWKIEEGSILEEACNSIRTNDCGCGVNFATRKWCELYYFSAEPWLCLIRWIDLCGVVVPYNTNGKARCSRLTLLKKVNTESS